VVINSSVQGRADEVGTACGFRDHPARHAKRARPIGSLLGSF